MTNDAGTMRQTTVDTFQANWNNENTSKTAVKVEIKILKIICFLVDNEQFQKIKKFRSN